MASDKHNQNHQIFTSASHTTNHRRGPDVMVVSPYASNPFSFLAGRLVYKGEA